MAARSGRAVLCSKCAAAALGLAAAVLVAGFVPDRQASDPIAVVGADIDVSRDPAVQSEVSIAIDPGDSRIILAGSNNWGRLTRAYSSRDGGSSWTASADPPLPPGSRQACAFGDPAVGIDRLGRQYYALLVALPCDLANLGGAAGTPQLFVARRANATAVWVTPPRPVAPIYPGDALRPGEADDKPSLTVDNSVASPQTNRVYVVWTRSGGAEAHRILLSHSDDGARTWSAPVRANDRPLSGSALASVAVGPRGDVYVLWDDLEARTIQIARSSDGGDTVGAARLVAREPGPRSPTCPSPGRSIPAQARRCVTAAAVVTVDGSNGRFAGRVYVTYGDGHDVFVAAFDPALRPLTRERVDPAPSDRFLPAAAVDPSNGRLWLCFYDTGANPSRACARYSCTTSRDGGRSFGRPVSAASVASNETGPSANRMQYGDYESLAVAGGRAHPIWTDSRDLQALKEEIYTRTLRG